MTMEMHMFTIGSSYSYMMHIRWISIGSFVFHRSSVLESRILELPTYYRLCYISMAITLNMTSLEVFPQGNLYFYFSTTTQNESLIPWSLVNISIPSYTRSLTGVYRNYRLWFIGTIADEFGTVGEGMDCYYNSYSCNYINGMCVLGEQMSSDVGFDFYIGLDDVTLTYCLPCNFDALNEPGCYIFP